MTRHVETGELVLGLTFALERLVPPRRLEDALAGFFALFETVAWAGGLSDRLRDERRAPPPGLEGMWYVRNIVLHQGADVLTSVIVEHGTTLDDWVLGQGILGVPTRREWAWPPRDELPSPRSLRGADDYDEHLAGREVSPTVRAVCDALKSDA